MRAAIPGKLNFGTPAGTLAHLTGELFRVRTGIDIVVIPYKGAATAVTDILGGQVDMTFEPTSVLRVSHSTPRCDRWPSPLRCAIHSFRMCRP